MTAPSPTQPPHPDGQPGRGRPDAYRSRWPLRWRLVALVIVLLAAIASVTGLASTLILRTSLMTQLDDNLRSAASRSVNVVSRGAPMPGANTSGVDVPGQGAGTVTLVTDGTIAFAWYIDSEGARAALTSEQRSALLELPVDAAVHTVHLGTLGTHRALAWSGGGLLVVTALSTGEVVATTERHVATTLAVTVAGLLVVGLLGTWLVRRELRPLERVAGTATRVAQLPLHSGEVRLADRVADADTDPTTEVGQVGAALNLLLGHVESALAARQASETQVRRFVADASHELRTPLASIRGYAELVRRGPDDVPPAVEHAIGRVESEAVRMTSLVEDLLLLARLDAGRPLDRGPVDLTALAADAVADAHAAGPDHTWRLVLPGAGASDGDEEQEGQDDGAHGGPHGADGDGADQDGAHRDGANGQSANGQSADEHSADGQNADEHPADEHSVHGHSADEHPAAGDNGDGHDDRAADTLVLGDDHALRQVLVNLLSNAAVHTPPGTTVTTTVRQDAGSVVLSVLDDGPGIDPDLQGRLFDRFSRGDAARSPGTGSTGLGLAIADAVVRAHGGRIEVDGTPGATTFTVTFPMSAPTTAQTTPPTAAPAGPPPPPPRTPPPLAPPRPTPRPSAPRPSTPRPPNT